MQASRLLPREKDTTDLMPGSKIMLGNQTLMAWVKDAVTAVDWVGKARDFHGFPAMDLVTLEVYCCAKGAVGSEEMEDWINSDPILRACFPNKHPKPPVIMAFRKCHRRDIQDCLSRVLDVALKARFGDDDQHQTPLDYCVVRGLDAWFNPRCGPNSNVEALERVRIPDWTDNMSEMHTPVD